jgi:glycosyltransferase involved in cell wall biosynthesis
MAEKFTMSPKPKIIHITTSHNSDDVRIVERECRSLAATGSFDLYLAAPGQNPQVDGLSFISLKYGQRTRLKRFLGGMARGHALSRSLDIDVWHFHDPELLPVALAVASSGRRVIWDAHEDYLKQFSELGSKSWARGPVRFVLRQVIRSLLASVDRSAYAIVAATPAIASRYSNPRTVVVGNEARVSDFENCNPSFASRRVLFTGSTDTGQSFYEVVQAVATVDGVQLVVAGRDPDPAIWEQATTLLGPRIIHLGWLNRGELIKQVDDVSIGLLTYADLPTNAENAPNKLFEFSAAGLPVVCTPTKSNLTFLSSSKGGVAAASFSFKDIADAIATLIGEQPQWQEASRSARTWSREHGNWASSEERLQHLYRSFLEEADQK